MGHSSTTSGFPSFHEHLRAKMYLAPDRFLLIGRHALRYLSFSTIEYCIAVFFVWSSTMSQASGANFVHAIHTMSCKLVCRQGSQKILTYLVYQAFTQWCWVRQWEPEGGRRPAAIAGWFRVKSCHVLSWRVRVMVWRAMSRLSVPCQNVS